MSKSELNETLAKQFSRQIALQGFGDYGQKRLSSSRLVIVGAGGLGCPAALYLAAAGVKSISIIDGDSVELTNLHRQTLFSKSHIGSNKAEVAAKILGDRDPSSKINPIPEFINADNAKRLLSDHQLILDGTDNFSSKYLLNDISLNLGIPLLSASIQGYQLQIALFNEKNSASYRCLFPEPPESAPNCSENGILGPVAGVAGCIQACEAIKFLADVEHLGGQMLLYNLLTHENKKIKLQRNDRLVQSTKVESQEYYDQLAPERVNPEHLVSASTLRTMVESGENIKLIDVRTKEEHLSKNIGGDLICKEDFLRDSRRILSEYSPNQKIVFYCERGLRSASVVSALKKDGITHCLFSLQGGLESY